MRTLVATFSQSHNDKMQKYIDAKQKEGYLFTNAVGSNGLITIFMTLDETIILMVNEGSEETTEEV